MGAFLIGLCLAVVVSFGAALGLNLFFERSTSEAFYTRDTVPLDTKAPTGGRLAHTPPQSGNR